MNLEISVAFDAPESFTAGLSKDVPRDAIRGAIKQLKHDHLIPANGLEFVASADFVLGDGSTDHGVVMRLGFSAGVLNQMNPDLVDDHVLETLADQESFVAPLYQY